MKSNHPAPAGNSSASGLLVFLHIPKTAGTTLNSILAHQYAPEAFYEVMMRGMSLRLPRPFGMLRPLISPSKIRRFNHVLKHRHSLRVIHGHFDLSLARLLPDDARFVTLLRHPVERAISHYCHYRKAAGDPAHSLAMRSTLEEWVGSSGLVEMDNGQTRRLAGEMTLPIGHVTSRTLAKAKSNLVDRFAVVGLTERFAESQILLHRQFNWPYGRYPALNASSTRMQRNELSAAALKVLEDRNHFDLQLYRFAAELFERAIRQIDKDRELALLETAPEYVGPAGAKPGHPLPASLVVT